MITTITAPMLYLGDCRDVLREMARMNGTGPRFTAIVTDPPAGISFMGKDWDNPNGIARNGSGIGQEGRDADYNRYGKGAVPYGYSGSNAGRNIADRESFIATMTEIASLALDLCLPGAHALVWALPRTSHWTATAWENGGWEVRDRIAHCFGSGFPKSLKRERCARQGSGRRAGSCGATR